MESRWVIVGLGLQAVLMLIVLLWIQSAQATEAPAEASALSTPEGLLAVTFARFDDGKPLTDAQIEDRAAATAELLGGRLLRRVGGLPASFLYAVPEGAADERHTRAALEPPFVEHTQVQAAVLRERRQEAQPDVHHLEELEVRSKNQTSSSTPLRRDKRSAATDPLFETQWHLHITRHDMGALEPWQRSIGSGVLVAVADDGLEWTHPDLRDAFNPGASYDFNRHAPSPAPTQSGDSHGTRCAGEIAAAVGNGVCGAGLAPGAMLAGLTILAGTVTDVVEADALSHSLAGENAIDIFSCSWGPRDTGTVLEGPGPLARAAVELGFTMGRYGRGAVYVWAAGNGGDGDGCMYDGYASSRYVVAIGPSGRTTWRRTTRKTARPCWRSPTAAATRATSRRPTRAAAARCGTRAPARRRPLRRPSTRSLWPRIPASRCEL